MSDERISAPVETNQSRLPNDDEYHLEDVIERLNVQINVFEQKLETAVHAETHFRNNVQGLLNSLDAFVARHVEKDRHLTQLIEEDTQRSKEAKEEYDALASRFDDNLRKHNFARTKAWLGTVSVYIGIVISFVLMAPLQAIWWLLSRSLTRMGLLRSTDETTLYSDVRGRRRYMPNKPASSINRRRSSDMSIVLSKEKDTTNASSSALNRKKVVKDDTATSNATKVKLSNKARDEKRKNHPDPTSLEDADHEGGKGFTKNKGETESNSTNGKAAGDPDQGESDDEFFDARNGSEKCPPSFEEIRFIEEEVEHDGKEAGDSEMTEDDGSKRDEGNDEYGRDDGSDEDDGEDGDDRESRDGEEEVEHKNESGENSPRRPGWAVPSSSDEGLPDLSNFPSSDFWDISDEDVRLEAQRSDRSIS